MVLDTFAAIAVAALLALWAMDFSTSARQDASVVMQWLTALRWPLTALVTGALGIGLWSRREPSTAPTKSRARPNWRASIAIAVGLMAGVLVLLVLAYNLGRNLVERSMRHRLEAVVTLKANLVQAWIDDNRDDIKTWCSGPEFERLLQAWNRDRSSVPAREGLVDYLSRHSRSAQYEVIELRDPGSGALLLSTHEQKRPSANEDRNAEAAVAAARNHFDATAHLEFQASASGHSTLRLALFLLVRVPKEGGSALVQADIEPVGLMRLISAWPGDADTAEVVLARREGRQLVIPVPAGGNPNGPASRDINAESPGSLAQVMAAKSDGGFVRGNDERGIPVLAFAVPVADGQWMLIAKIDEAEALGEFHRIFGLGVAVSLLLLVMGGWWTWDVQTRLTQSRLLLKERAEHARRVANLSSRIESVQELERGRLAAELHDRTAANLAAIQLNLRTVERSLTTTDEELTSLLDESGKLLADTIVGIREFCAELRPALLEYAGPAQALAHSVNQFVRRTGIEAEFDASEFEGRCSPGIEMTLFRLTQEALLNCAKHSNARHVAVRLARAGPTVTLEISDDGVGFDPQALGQDGRAIGNGVLNMRERAEYAEGRLTVDSAPGQGTRIRFEAAAAGPAPQPESVD